MELPENFSKEKKMRVWSKLQGCHKSGLELIFVEIFEVIFQRAPNTREFAQPRLSRVKERSSPARGYKFGCVCSFVAGHEDAWVMTGHTRTNTPKSVTPSLGTTVP